jgi:SAM-dependent methyltransferase
VFATAKNRRAIRGTKLRGTMRERDVDRDPIEAFYDRHPYPPPVAELDALARSAGDLDEQRFAHHLVWPRRRFGSASRILVAGCGTSQAARYAMSRPGAAVTGIDVSATSIEHTRRLAERHGLANLEVRRLPIERVAELAAEFDYVVCTGVLHHLVDPAAGLAALREVLAPGGAMLLMVYARFGRFGIDLMHEYCERLGVTTERDELVELGATLREIPRAHPLDRLLRETRDFHDDDALADALLNPRERAYSVPELLELLDGAALQLTRWERQAPYLPDCGALASTPHGARIAALEPGEQYALLELFRGAMTRHTAIVVRDDGANGSLDFGSAEAGGWVPIRAPTAVAVEERLPPGAAAALLNSAHEWPDLVMFVSEGEFEVFRAIDGRREIATLGEGARSFVERLWRHDLVAVDASRGAGAG